MQKNTTPIAAAALWIIALCGPGCRANLTVEQVVSADTVILSNGDQVRYAGVEAYPQGTDAYEISRLKNALLVQGKTVKLVVESRLSTSEEIVAFVYTPVIVDGKERYLLVNVELLRWGYVTAVPVPPACEHREIWEGLWQFHLQDKEGR